MPPYTQTQRNRRGDSSDGDDVDEARENGSANGSGSGSVQQLAKNLVRYALACEYARRPIKRQEINEKGEQQSRAPLPQHTRTENLQTHTNELVLGAHKGRFKDVFNQANGELMDVFGMALVELSKADRVTVRQKRGTYSGKCLT
jgi:hypothetical protein